MPLPAFVVTTGESTLLSVGGWRPAHRFARHTTTRATKRLWGRVRLNERAKARLIEFHPELAELTKPTNHLDQNATSAAPGDLGTRSGGRSEIVIAANEDGTKR
jgi:hypothetical protein